MPRLWKGFPIRAFCRPLPCVCRRDGSVMRMLSDNSTEVAAVLAGSYIPTGADDAERCAWMVEDAIQPASTVEERERLYRLAAGYWEQA